MAAEYAAALGRPITYVDVPLEQWRDQELRRRQLPDHVVEHLLTMAHLHAANRYDRLTHDVEAIIGQAGDQRPRFRGAPRRGVWGLAPQRRWCASSLRCRGSHGSPLCSASLRGALPGCP